MAPALTEFSLYMTVVGFVGCVAMIAHAVLAPARVPEGAEPAGRAARVLLLPLEFLVICLWLSVILRLVAGLFWGGGKDHWFDTWSPVVAGGLALVFVAYVGYRVLAHAASRAYVRVQTIAATLLLLLFGAVQLYDFVQPIGGRTPTSAAERALEEVYPAVAQDRPTLVEEGRTSKCIVYVAEGESGSRARITVCRYGRWWWRVRGVSLLIPPAAKNTNAQGGRE